MGMTKAESAALGRLARWGVTTPEERFWSHVIKTDGCWLWQGHIGRREGYGKFRAPTGIMDAHRFAYLTVNPIPAGLVLDHLCRVRHCVNPAHLEPVTDRQNIMRGQSLMRRNAEKTHCDHGHPFDEANTYHEPRGGRQCRACNVLRSQKYKATH